MKHNKKIITIIALSVIVIASVTVLLVRDNSSASSGTLSNTNSEESIVSEMPEPSYGIKTQGEVQKDIERTQEEKAAVDDGAQVKDTSSAQGSGSVKEPIEMVPADPDKMLSSGITLREAWEVLMPEYNQMKADGYTEKELKGLFDSMAKDLGTTMEEVKRVPDAPKVVKPSNNKPSTSTNKPSTSTNKPSTSTNKPADKPSNSGGQSGEFDNGLGDMMAGTEGGYTTPDPDFNLGTVGD